jgi:penicillin-binding protein 1C
LNKKLKIMLVAAGVIIAPVLLSPLPEFSPPLSTVVEARDGSLLGARIADDGQWRFPPGDSVPYKFEKAIITFEDNYFYRHPGVNPVAIAKALINNIKAGTVVSGGSTLTMQVARLSRGNKPRTYIGKMIEILSAFKLEIFKSKREILKLYTSNAPFGGNTVGLDAATWRYYGSSPYNLSWSEAAALAVLPNAPSLVFPGKNQEKLKSRRDGLLRKLYAKHFFDSTTLVLSLEESLPGEPAPLPSKAPHLTDYFFKNNRGQRIRTTIDPVLQEQATEKVNAHQKILENNFIFNSSCIIVGVEKGEVLAYVGNSSLPETSTHGGDVDVIRALRSTGSILKPILYAGMQYSGDILPNTLIPDIPTHFQGFSPKNFDLSYSGAVSADYALSQSLNIPSVRLLQKFGYEKFLDLLHKCGFTSFNKTADYYGLSLILGGGEASLWEITGVYSSISRVLNRFNHEKKYIREDWHPPVMTIVNRPVIKDTSISVIPLSASSIWLTYEALHRVNRPESEAGWQYFSNPASLAWKTGTSFGFRDAWAVGTTPEYVIGVWAGNADGEGRPGLTGITAAAPLLFDIVGLLKTEKSFVQPLEEMTTIKICNQSGYRAGPDCPETHEVWATVAGLKSDVCPYHKIVHLNKSRTLRVTSACEDPSMIVNEPWFVLPPAIEYFYRQKHPDYKTLPPPAPGCTDDKSIPAMEFIYPTPGIRIFIPRDQTGLLTRVVPEVAHRNPSKKIFWHLDDKYITTTRFLHRTELLASEGNHLLTCVDEDGNSIKCQFSVISGTSYSR